MADTLADLIVSILDDDLRARRARLEQRRADHAGHVARAQFWRDYETNRYTREQVEERSSNVVEMPRRTA